MNYAIDRDEINKVIEIGLGQPTSAILAKEHWAYDQATANYYTHDIDKAKALLAEAGHPNGIEIEAYGWADQTAMKRQELIMGQLAKSRHPHQAHPGGAANGDDQLHVGEERLDAVQPNRRLS